jgi:hypothetical protein
MDISDGNITSSKQQALKEGNSTLKKREKITKNKTRKWCEQHWWKYACPGTFNSKMYGIDHPPITSQLTSSIPGNGWRLMSNINQHTEFLSHVLKCENSDMMLTSSTSIKEKEKSKKPIKKIGTQKQGKKRRR